MPRKIPAAKQPVAPPQRASRAGRGAATGAARQGGRGARQNGAVPVRARDSAAVSEVTQRKPARASAAAASSPGKSRASRADSSRVKPKQARTGRKQSSKARSSRAETSRAKSSRAKSSRAMAHGRASEPRLTDPANGPSRSVPGSASTPMAQRGGALIHERRLDNGLRVLLAERHRDPVVSVILFYRVGAVDEREAEAGVSHFLEHMMFKGTPRFGKGSIDRRTAMLGGQNNAFTGYDHTGYWYEFSSDRWEEALVLESDRMRHLLLDPAEFASEREVVLEELAMGEDEPWRVLGRRVEARLFGRHPYGRPIIGFPDTLRGMTPESMRAHYRRFYHPRNATLLICGDVIPNEAFARAQAHFGSLGLDAEPGRRAPGARRNAPAREPGLDPAPTPVDALTPRRSLRPPAEEPFGEQRLEMRWPDPAKRLCMAWRAAPAGTPDDYALDLIVVLLTSGRNSRLQRRLVLDGALATSVSAYNDSRVEDGAFWLQAQCRDGVEPSVLEAAIDAELARLAAEGPSDAELDRARRMLKASEAHDAETTSDLAEELGSWAIDVDWTHALDGGERHAAVQAAAVRDVAQRLLQPARRVVGWCLPAPAGPAATGPAQASSADEEELPEELPEEAP